MKRIVVILCLIAVFAPAAAAQDADKMEIVNKLSKKIDCDYEGLPLADVINDIKNKSGIANIVPAPEVKAQVESNEGDSAVTLHAKGITVRTALKYILAAKKLTAIYKDGALTITTEENAKKKVTTLVYDIRDLLYSVTNFPGPRVDLLPPDTYKEKFGGLSGGALAGNTFTLGGADERTTADPGFIIDVIKKNTKGGEEGWDGDQNIEEKAGMLIVTTTKSKHEEVKKMIALIRQFK